MSKISRKLRSMAFNADGTVTGIGFWCPGCGERHGVPTNGPNGWTFDGDINNPTLSPSILVRSHKIVRDENGRWTGKWVLDAEGKTIPTICHSFVSAGQIEFLSDCTHELAGKTVEIPDLPDKDNE